MYPREAIDFEEPYVSPYLRRPLRTVEQALQAIRGGNIHQTDVSRSPCREGLPAAGAALGQGTTAPGPPSAARRSE